ncbi:MAG: G1 family glutamic endopeptidase [Solirubrobacteraceae bacterium]
MTTPLIRSFRKYLKPFLRSFAVLVSAAAALALPAAAALALPAAAALALPASASADTSTSENWSGYAVHANGVTFKKVSGGWRQPGAACTQGESSYAAFWVGLGGYNLNSNALEQIGTEVDCVAGVGEEVYAWYELVPQDSDSIHMTIRPGDLIGASVQARGPRVTLTLTDRTRHKSFAKTLVANPIDLSSAEWIAEAPSECENNGQCQTLTLADFGSATFSGAGATTENGRTGAISSPMWDATKIVLSAGTSRFVSDGAAAGDGVLATPSALRSGGSAFTVTYSGSSGGFGSGAGSGGSGSGGSGSGGGWGGGGGWGPGGDGWGSGGGSGASDDLATGPARSATANAASARASVGGHVRLP